MQALVAAVLQFLGLEVGQLAVGIAQRTLEEGGHLLGVAVGAAHGLVDDLVHQAQGLEAVGRDAHGIGRVLGLLAGLPEDGGAAFRADHGVDGVLQHQHLVGNGNGQCAARAAFTDDGGDDVGLQLCHFVDVAADGFGLAALLGLDAGESAGRVHEGEDRQAELLGRLHETQGLAVALGARHAEVAQRALLGVAALLVADDHAGHAIEARQPAHDGLVVGKVPVPVHLDEVGEAVAHIVQRVGALGMARDLGDLPGREVAVDVLGQLQALFAELLDLFRDVDCAFGLHVAQFLDFGFELGDGLLKIQKVLFRQLVSPCPSQARCMRSDRKTGVDRV